MTLTFDLTYDLNLGCFKVKFRNSCIPGIVGLIDVKWKGSKLIWYWADCMTLPLDRTHDLDLGVSRSESEIAISQEWGCRLTLNEKDVSHQFMTMMLTSVTMVWWVDVPDSEQGDFRRRRAVNKSSSFWSSLPYSDRCLVVMAFCLTTISPYLNRSWGIYSGNLWHTPKTNFTRYQLINWFWKCSCFILPQHLLVANIISSST